MVRLSAACLCVALLGLASESRAERVASALTCQIDRPGSDGNGHGNARAQRASPLWDGSLRELGEFGQGKAIDGRERPYYVAFTFDDGPKRQTTPRVLDALDRYDIPATFFVVGWRFAGKSKNARAGAALIRDALRRGYTIGNHTFHHHNLARLSPAAMRREIDDNTRALTELLGYTPHAFRPPFGAMTRRAREHLRREGFTEVRWSIDSYDFRVNSAALLRRNTTARIIARRGGVVLFHDTKQATAKVIAQVLDDLERENCRRLEGSGKRLIVPVSLHYFMRNRDGTARSVPPEARARTRRYLDKLPQRCRQRKRRTPGRKRSRGK